MRSFCLIVFIEIRTPRPWYLYEKQIYVHFFFLTSSSFLFAHFKREAWRRNEPSEACIHRERERCVRIYTYISTISLCKGKDIAQYFNTQFLLLLIDESIIEYYSFIHIYIRRLMYLRASEQNKRISNKKKSQFSWKG